MSSDILAALREEIKAAEAQLLDVARVIEVMKKAGEDTTAMQAKYMNTKARLERYKKALG